MKAVFHYSIIRFQPFADIGEFANIGIVALAPEQGELGYRLARKRFARLHDFFGEEAYRAYPGTIDHLRNHLGIISGEGDFFAPDSARNLFDHLIRSRESTIIFSEPRAVLFDSTMSDLLDALFSRLVMRQRQEAHDLTLIGGIRQALRRHGVDNFRTIRMDDDVVPVTFPLAHQNGNFRAIHPLVFAQKTPMAIFDHGALWKKRLSYLLGKNKLNEHSVLLAVEPPHAEKVSALTTAYHEAMEEISQLPFEKVQGETRGVINNRIIEFARDAIPSTRTLFRTTH